MNPNPVEVSPMQSIPIDSTLLTFAGALDLARTDSGFIPRRLPAWTKSQIADVAMEAVVQLPAGVRLALTTSASTIEIDLQLTLIRQVPRELRPAVFDLLVDGELLAQSATATGNVISLGPAPGEVAFEPGGPTTVSFSDLPQGTRAVEVWLPAHAAVEFRALRINHGALIERTGPTLPRWIHYGSSISHCVSAASPVKTWPAMVARSVGLEHTNLGFAGQCMLDPFVARTIRDSDADARSSFGATATRPSGLATCDATLARCFVRATPTDKGRPISSRTRRRMASAISVGAPKRWTTPATSRNASSIDTRSTRGVKSWKTDTTSSPNSW